ncbi:MAG: LysM peptidoglycan-binding domain-containing protein [Bacteroidia bacterium]|nr:LysM peptidoglycan-binding domain-containing protein [Bacteroidia bacterium]MDG2042796.1 LysM peptidoglycan-binding domain-containing protein [Bacteroidia bacterium]|tara:strand:- start:8396 stop:9793 length:1398 start_codon:yes stop_codon:yes gene_type:complete
MRPSLTILLSFLILILHAQKQTPTQYIDRYKELAIIEMHRSGVPASITLSQGVLESSSGNSRLAKFANNHFGIKCKGNWTGKTIYANDDAPDECFRAYGSVLESYKDHSDFLRKNWRYHELFELKITDYKGWCHGLRKAGYATNPQYGKILINLIERYELYQYDTRKLPKKKTPEEGEKINGVPVKIASKYETVRSIANENYLKDKHIRKWNDLPRDEEIKTGEIVYLKPKRRRGSEQKHIVTSSDNMRSISQTYGIKLKHLYKKNRMETGTEPKEGEVLYMHKKRASDDPIKTEVQRPNWEEEKKFINPSAENQRIIDSTQFNNPGAINKVTIKVPDFHIIVKGNNIYRIAEKYHVLEEDILKWNPNLNPNAMRIGQKIILKEELSSSNNLREEDDIKEKLSNEETEKIQKTIVVDGTMTHIVVKGDTLYNICKRYSVTIEQLKQWNNIENITIQIGQKLIVSP